MARRITATAVATRMSKLEAETGKLRQKLAEKEHVILGLQERVFHAQTILQEMNAKLLLSIDEQVQQLLRVPCGWNSQIEFQECRNRNQLQ